MTKTDPPDPVKTAALLAQMAGAAAGVVVELPSAAYFRKRSPEHIAEVARRAQDHAARNVAIDSYQQGRDSGQNDKAIEIVVQPQDPLAGIIAMSQGSAKQTGEKR